MSKKTPEHPWEKIPRGALVLFVWSLSEKRKIFRQFTAAKELSLELSACSFWASHSEMRA